MPFSVSSIIVCLFVQFVPFSGDCMILSGAEDREVRQHDLKSCETVKVSRLPFRGPLTHKPN